MGGIHKKPISAMDKTAKKKLSKAKGVEGKSTGGEERLPIITSEVLRKARSIVRNLRVITPYTLVNNLNITYSVAKGILKRLESEGLIKLISRNRRVLIYVQSEALKKVQGVVEA